MSSAGQQARRPAAPGTTAAPRIDVPRLMTASGVSPVLSVLYLTDYVHATARAIATQALAKQLERAFPSHRISVAVAERPFEDVEGTNSRLENSLSYKMKRSV